VDWTGDDHRGPRVRRRVVVTVSVTRWLCDAMAREPCTISPSSELGERCVVKGSLWDLEWWGRVL
jgi:hypothetical protein